MNIINKLACPFVGRVKFLLEEYNSCIVAFSGGVDSTLLLSIALEVFKEKCLAVIITSPLHSERESLNAIKWLKSQNINFKVIEEEPLKLPQVAQNHSDRCYHCKKQLFGQIQKIADAENYDVIIDGTNYSDKNSYRPGRKALKELGILSPLALAKLTKPQIREIAKTVYSLPQADLPSRACYATRFPYNTKITDEKLKIIDTLELYLLDHGYSKFRVRLHDNLVRLEFPLSEIGKFTEDQDYCEKFITLAKQLGISFITIDLEGLKSGCFDDKILS